MTALYNRAHNTLTGRNVSNSMIRLCNMSLLVPENTSITQNNRAHFVTAVLCCGMQSNYVRGSILTCLAMSDGETIATDVSSPTRGASALWNQGCLRSESVLEMMQISGDEIASVSTRGRQEQSDSRFIFQSQVHQTLDFRRLAATFLCSFPFITLPKEPPAYGSYSCGVVAINWLLDKSRSIFVIQKINTLNEVLLVY